MTHGRTPNARKDHIKGAWLQDLSKITECDPLSLSASTAASDEILCAAISPLPTQGLQLHCNFLRAGKRGIFPRCIEVCKAPILGKSQQLTSSCSWNCSHGDGLYAKDDDLFMEDGEDKEEPMVLLHHILEIRRRAQPCFKFDKLEAS
jgi:hypothetical protein